MTVPTGPVDPAHQVNPVDSAVVEPTNPPEPTWWDEFSQSVDEPFRPLIQEQFTKWEEQARAKVNEQLGKYAPYSEFLTDDVNPEFVKRALDITKAIDADPEGVFRDFAAHIGYDLEEAKPAGQQQPQQPVNPQQIPQQMPTDPWAGFNEEELSPFEKMARDQFRAMQAQSQAQMAAISQIGTYLQSQNEMSQATSEEQKVLNWLDQQKKGHEAYWDQAVALTYISGGGELSDAIEMMKARHIMKNGNGNPGFQQPGNQAGNQAPPQDPAPKVIGSGNLPSNQKPVTELDKKQTEDLVVSMINAAQQAAHN